MMDKKRFILVIVLLFALVLIEDSFADSCCINLEGGSELTCKVVTESACSISSPYEYYDISCSQVAECTEKCFTCSDATDNAVFRNVWSPLVIGCNVNELGWVSVPSSATSITTEEACTEATTPPTSTPLTVSGRVTENNVGKLGATVTCSLSTATTDSNGDYSLSSCNSGTETIRATLGTKSGTTTITLPPSKTGVIIALVSATTAALTVNVKNSTGAALSSSVTVSGLNGYSSSKTGSSVQFSNVPVGTIQIKVEKAGYAASIQPYTLTSSGGIVDVVLTQTTTKTLSGDVNSSVSPRAKIIGAAVELFHYANNVKITDGQTITNSNGRYAMTVPTGTNYILEGKAGTYDTNAISSVSITDNKIQHIFLTPASGTVTNVEYTFNIQEQGTKTAIPNAYVQLLNEDQQLNSYVYSNSNGVAKTTLAKGTYTLRANKDTAYQQYITTITISNTSSFDVSMVPLAKLTISGKVIDSVTKSAISGQIIATNYLTETRLIAKDQAIGNQGTIELTSTECTAQQNLGTLTLFDPVFVNKQIKLEWDVSPCSPKTFILERKTGAGDYAAIKEIAPNTFLFSDDKGYSSFFSDYLSL